MATFLDMVSMEWRIFLGCAYGLLDMAVSEEGKLFLWDYAWEDWLYVEGNYFGGNLVNEIAKGYGSEVNKRLRLIHLGNEGDEGGIEGFRHISWSFVIFGDQKEVLNDKLKEGDVKFDEPTILPRTLIFTKTF